jgi:hypothetical protein
MIQLSAAAIGIDPAPRPMAKSSDWVEMTIEQADLRLLVEPKSQLESTIGPISRDYLLSQIRRRCVQTATL